jgi:hypothetical protein
MLDFFAKLLTHKEGDHQREQGILLCRDGTVDVQEFVELLAEEAALRAGHHAPGSGRPTLSGPEGQEQPILVQANAFDPAARKVRRRGQLDHFHFLLFLGCETVAAKIDFVCIATEDIGRRFCLMGRDVEKQAGGYHLFDS